MRLNEIDGIRGHLLLGMMIAHLALQGLPELFQIHHVRVFRLYDGEFFVPISGLMVGILTYERMGTVRKLYKFIRTRLRVIYKYYLIGLIPALALTFGNLYGYGLDGQSPFAYILGLLTLQEGTKYASILVLYLYCFLFLALVAWSIERFGDRLILGASFVIYLISQTTYMQGFFGSSGQFMAFDCAAWQFLFIGSFSLGLRYRQIGELIQSMPLTWFYLLLALSVVVTVVLRQSDWYPNYGRGPQPLAEWARFNLNPMLILNILAICTFFTLMLVRSAPVTGGLSRLLRWYFMLYPLRAMGQKSIQVFTLHVVLMMGFTTLAKDLPHDTRLAIACGLLVIFVAGPTAWVWNSQRRRKAAA